MSAAVAAPLPAGWSEFSDPSSGRSYYHNPGTGETTWDRPAGSAPAGSDSAASAPTDAALEAAGLAAAAQMAAPGGFDQGMAQNFGADMSGMAAAHNMGMYGGAGAGMAQGMPAYGMTGMGLDASSQFGGAMGGAMAAAPSTAGMRQGTVKVWFEDKGFGFLAQAEGGDDVFVHRNTLQDGQSLVQGALVNYLAEWSAQRNKFAVTRCVGAVALGGKPGTPPSSSAGGAAPAAAPAPMPGSSGSQTSGTGTCKVWFDEKGFGFITPSGGGNDIFVHRNALSDGQMLVQGQQVSFAAEFSASKNKMAVTTCTGATDRPGVAGIASAAGMIGGMGAAGSRFSPYPGGAPMQQPAMGYGAL